MGRCDLFVVFLGSLVLIDRASQAKGQTRCYEDPPIGCFSNTYPHNNTQNVPVTVEKIDLHYIHYGQTETRVFTWRQAKDGMKLKLQTNLKTVVIIHGWQENGHRQWILTLAEMLLRQEPMNILIVDWFGGARGFNYLQSAANGRVVGAMVAFFFKELQTIGANLSSFHLICNSLGSHVCGHVGANVAGIGRITGMDPSGRAMTNAHPLARLDPTDATVVDVIHTDVSSGFGKLS